MERAAFPPACAGRPRPRTPQVPGTPAIQNLHLICAAGNRHCISRRRAASHMRKPRLVKLFHFAGEQPQHHGRNYSALEGVPRLLLEAFESRDDVIRGVVRCAKWAPGSLTPRAAPPAWPGPIQPSGHDWQLRKAAGDARHRISACPCALQQPACRSLCSVPSWLFCLVYAAVSPTCTLSNAQVQACYVRPTGEVLREGKMPKQLLLDAINRCAPPARRSCWRLALSFLREPRVLDPPEPLA
jgi:hypothetical protein